MADVKLPPTEQHPSEDFGSGAPNAQRTVCVFVQGNPPPPASELCQKMPPLYCDGERELRGGRSNQPWRRYSFRLFDKRQMWLPVPKIGTGRSTLGSRLDPRG